MSKIADKILSIVRAKSGQTTSIEVAIAMHMSANKSQCDRIAVEISQLVKAGKLVYGAKATWDVPGVQRRTRHALEIVPEIDLSKAREMIYSESMTAVLDMILDGASASKIAEEKGLSKRLVTEMIMNLTNEDGLTRRRSMRNMGATARRKRIASALKDQPPEPSRSKWEKPKLYNSIFAVAQGQSIDMPRRR